MSILNDLSKALQDGNREKVEKHVNEALDMDMNAGEILNEGLLKGMSVVGKKFKNNEIYVPEVLIAARAMKRGMEILRPKLVGAGVKSLGIVTIGTVRGDLHDIGKNLVGMMLEGANFEVYDLGVDVTAEDFVKAVKEKEPQILGLSALLTTTMTEMKSVIKLLEEEGLKDKVKVMVGGAPVTEDFAKKIGADGYANDASSAADLAKSFVH